jgi:hypothetical protein
MKIRSVDLESFRPYEGRAVLMGDPHADGTLMRIIQSSSGHIICRCITALCRSISVQAPVTQRGDLTVTNCTMST